MGFRGVLTVDLADVSGRVWQTLPRVAEVTVDLVFDPSWDRSRLSERAQLMMGLCMFPKAGGRTHGHDAGH